MINELFNQIKDNITTVINRSSELGQKLYDELISEHSADIAAFLKTLDSDISNELLISFPDDILCSTFLEFSVSHQVHVLDYLNDEQKIRILSNLSADELTDLFSLLSDLNLKHCLNLLHKKDRQAVISLMEFHSESAGGIMNTDVLVLIDDFTVHESIKLIQRLHDHEETQVRQFVVNKHKQLVGYIHIEDLIFNKPDRRLNSFMKKIDFSVHPDQDRESIAHEMIKYNLMVMPVVAKDNFFLGIISSSTLIDVIEKEASEDIYKMSAMSPVKETYLDIPFWQLLYQRGNILIVLLLFQSLSSTIIKSYDVLLQGVAGGILMQFLTMITSTGGNASSQTSAIIIQGMATGEISESNMKKFFKREYAIAFAMSLILGITTFIRVYLTSKMLIASIAVSISLSVVVALSIVIGSSIPVLLKRFNIDPAYSAGPVLATLLDILGLLTYCMISNAIFS